MKEALVMRADSAQRMGTGHVMRCLALAQAWQDAGGRVVFATTRLPPVMEARLRQEDALIEHVTREPGSLQDAAQTIELTRRHEGQRIVVDGYQFSSAYQEEIKKAGLSLLFMDDYGHCDHYCADFVVNPNVHAKAGLYHNRESNVRVLLGARYTPLRREFLRWRGHERPTLERAERVLVTLGGSDADNVTLKVIEALDRIESRRLDVCVPIGAACAHVEALQTACRQSRHAMRLETDIVDMAALMARADVAVTAGGSTCWELAFMGLPNLALIVADNQQPIAEHLDSLGISVNLGWHDRAAPDALARKLQGLLESSGRRQEMSRLGRKLVDGEGAGRICMALGGQRLRLRPVFDEDCRRLWEWANDPQTRAAAFTMDPIPWESHAEWFACRRRDPNSRILIALDRDDAPVGQIRFYPSGLDEAEIDVSVGPSHRGQGYGSLIINQGATWMFARTPMRVLHAYVRPDNAASIRAFENAGFHNCGTKTISGVVSQHHVREKHDG